MNGIDQAERIVIDAVARAPLHLAGVVNDLIFDRKRGSRRAIDPMIARRHGDAIADAVERIGEDLLEAEVEMPLPGMIPPHVMSRSLVQTAIAQLLHHTHVHMRQIGLGRIEDMPDLAVGRAMIAAQLSTALRDTMRVKWGPLVDDYERRAVAAA